MSMSKSCEKLTLEENLTQMESDFKKQYLPRKLISTTYEIFNDIWVLYTNQFILDQVKNIICNLNLIYLESLTTL